MKRPRETSNIAPLAHEENEREGPMRRFTIQVAAILLVAVSAGCGSSASTATTTTSTISAATTTTAAALPAFEPLEVTFQSIWELQSEDQYLGTFTASGPAVDAGMMCPEGRHWTQSVAPSWVERYLCDDGSGGFATLSVPTSDHQNDTSRYNSGVWTLAEGSGVYEAMSGEGTFEGTWEGGAQKVEYGTLEGVGQVWRNE
jgi:hypothetical protein